MSNPTSNYSFIMPTSTDLVTDLPADFEVFGQAVDTQMKTNADAAINKTIVDAKGDIIAATAADTVSRLAVGSNGQVLTADSTAATGVKWATASAGLNWTQRQGAIVTGTIQTIGYNGSNLYVAAGTQGKLYTSPDGITWTSRTSGFGGATTIRKVFYGNSLWVAVGDSGIITTSTDGVTWTARTSNMSTNTIRDVIYANSLWVAVGAGGGATNTGGITYSTDGVTWTRKSQSLTVGAVYNGVIYNGTNWIVAASLSTNNFLYATTPSGTWTAAVLPSVLGEAFNAIFFDGTRVLGFTTTYTFYSTSTTLATATVLNNLYLAVAAAPDEMRQNYLYNGRLYQQTNAYYQNYSTTPATDTSYLSDSSTISLLPSIQGVTSGNLNVNSCAIFAGAAGVILGTSMGQIYTSF